MYKILFIILLLAGCASENPDQSAHVVVTPPPAEQLLGIDETVIYFNYMASSACWPFLLPDNNAYYCSIDDVIYFGNGLKHMPLPVQYFILAHEDGHSDDPNKFDWSVTEFEREQYADCYAGIQLRTLYNRGHIDDNDMLTVTHFINQLGHDPTHGSGQQRYNAMHTGFTSNNCRS